MYGLVNDFASFCTSIVAQQADGKIIMARNIDFPDFFSDYMSSILYKARFVKDGVYQFDALMFHGTVGVFTGFKAGAWSASSNSRILFIDNDYNGQT